MSQEKIKNENIDTDKEDNAVDNGDVRLAVKKKTFKKSDILVLAVCIVTSVLIWLYASNLQKISDEKDMKDREAAAQAALDKKEEEEAKGGKETSVDNTVNNSTETIPEATKRKIKEDRKWKKRIQTDRW